MTDLTRLISAWKSSAEAVIALVREVDDYQLDTDLPGWTIHDIIAHLAHLEVVFAHGETDATASSPDDVSYTERGVEARRYMDTADVIDEFEAAVKFRLQHEVVGEPNQPAPNAPGGSGWTWETSLRNRALDMWVHEQDIRRVINRPGNLDSEGAWVVAETFASGMGYVLGKKVGAPIGTTVRWVVTGDTKMDFAYSIGDDKRARPSNQEADCTLTMTSEEFTILGAGRKNPAELAVVIEGDQELGHAVLENMAVTP